MDGFEDLHCHGCDNVAPLLEEAQQTYKIPLVRHDFPLTMHNWSKQAALRARYFDTTSKKIGDEFRDYCFRHQAYPGKETPYINNPEDLRQQAERFAAARKIALPLVIDPQGKLQAKVEADLNLGIAVGIEHTPTIFVVSDKQQGKPFVEVVDRRNLYSQIDEMIAEAGGTTKPATGKKRAATKPTI